MKLKLYTDECVVRPIRWGGLSVEVSVEVEAVDVLRQIDFGDIFNYLEVPEVLDEIGFSRVMEYFGLVEETKDTE